MPLAHLEAVGNNSYSRKRGHAKCPRLRFYGEMGKATQRSPVSSVMLLDLLFIAAAWLATGQLRCPEVQADRNAEEHSAQGINQARPEVEGEGKEPRPNEGDQQAQHTDADHGLWVF